MATNRKTSGDDEGYFDKIRDIRVFVLSDKDPDIKMMKQEKLI